ncbi:tRNA1(Val) (adenine(37)-N6)-methyltransferase [Helicovermis profundi]|uniref:tRNA1(Val) (Adenine(37)-N6)-methyltransferase n=1 Tax=Helicovermis profundi TaxID=3065157 RepID=A0AAU9E8Z3_9FIRM|nr:tRNA1(Val) (adenine(37)-N6)-methyltransferase [Clostridia bacterium S502]
MSKNLLKENERIDDLQLNGLKIIQNKKGFCFGIDAVLLSNFVKIKNNQIAVDLGTGTGIIPLLISEKTNVKNIIAFEIQNEVYDMALRSVKLNNLENKITIINDDLNNVEKHIKKNSIDVVISNPPYFTSGGALLNPSDYKAISRHEVMCTFDDIARNTNYMLKPGGQFFLIHRPHRLVDVICTLRKYKLEPKEIRFVAPKRGKKPNIMLIKASKFGNSELKFLDPLIVYNDDGTYTDEIFDIYDGVKIDVFDKRGK